MKRINDIVNVEDKLTLCELTNALEKVAYDPLDDVDEDTLLTNRSVSVDLNGTIINICFNITTKCECLLDTLLEITKIEEI